MLREKNTPEITVMLLLTELLTSLSYPGVFVGAMAILLSPPSTFINLLCRWVEVGQASVVMAISSPHRHDGQQAIQHCISQLKAKIPIWKKARTLKYKGTTALSWVLPCHHSFINRKFMTHKTAAGRRTLNVRGQLTTNVPRKQQITDCAAKNSWRKF